MVMESRFHGFSDYTNGFALDDENILPTFDHSPSLATGYRFRDEPLDLSFLDLPSPAPNHDPVTLNAFPGMPPQVHSTDEFADCVSRYLNEFLVEEDMESKQSTFHNPFTLQTSPLNFGPNVESPEEVLYGSSSEYSTYSSTSGSNFTDPRWLGSSDSFETKSSVTQTHSREYPSFGYTTRLTNDVNDTMDSFINTQMAQNIFTNSESILQFKRGMEEASKFLPPSKPLFIDLGKFDLPSDSTDASLEVAVKVEKVEMDNSSIGFRGRKHHHLEDNDYEDERSSKQSAVYEEEAELSEMFDRILLCTNAKGEPMPGCGDPPNHLSNNLRHVYSGWNAPSWGPAITSDSVDVKTLLLNCAQSVAADDYMIANEQLKQIRHHASPSGNASQRLAHMFALGLEARLSGTGSQLYASQKVMRVSAAEKLKAFQAYMSACPFKSNELYFANRTIYETALTSSTLHIVDFGIGYGFQWPILIKHLANRPGGPPKVRITGVDLPQSGFRPAERVEETGRQLANYCERFKVSFEYESIAAQNWEMIKIEDLKLQRNEFLAVNALGRFENLLDETVVANSPRDGVLKLIRDMKPDIFVHSVVNGCYSAPFFVTRFREALFHYSSLFDMLDATLDRKKEQRQNFEKAFYGREAMNVIACEGPERVERPETYKQWQVRNLRAGFKPRRLDRELVSQVKGKVKAGYHKDFVFDEDGKWIVQGWKGRILYAISCWVPA
ncbi:scarecrow-like protein 14 [Cynara cardunculus var. scolymus]|uniref:scarecrow-like protein 14 n=1 Tax=Cynara cardunculus var. scolymus TaxID=59895 RepID=UPI000D627D17|nr:scarecrow-like protein 14 [Cynara cardunculus var. scolymus]